MSKKVICFGEMLWDCIPDKEIPGGAPMNVALHLQQLGLSTAMISRIGEDKRGDDILDFVKNYGLRTDLIQRDSVHPTGIVRVNNDDPENIKYTIVPHVAWDYIEATPSNYQAVSEVDALIFGTLAIRSQQSWDTLLHLLPKARLKIFDINLRAPFFDFEQIEVLLGKCEILKINEDELAIVADYFDIQHDTKSVCQLLTAHFPIQWVCVTLGARGAMIFEKGNIHSHPGYKVKVEDTVGSGDAFLAGFVKSFLEGKSPDEILDFACALGAFVATKKGGTPRYEQTDIMKIVVEKP